MQQYDSKGTLSITTPISSEAGSGCLADVVAISPLGDNVLEWRNDAFIRSLNRFFECDMRTFAFGCPFIGEYLGNGEVLEHHTGILKTGVRELESTPIGKTVICLREVPRVEADDPGWSGFWAGALRLDELDYMEYNP